jgi:hypothetical protein
MLRNEEKTFIVRSVDLRGVPYPGTVVKCGQQRSLGWGSQSGTGVGIIGIRSEEHKSKSKELRGLRGGAAVGSEYRSEYRSEG